MNRVRKLLLGALLAMSFVSVSPSARASTFVSNDIGSTTLHHGMLASVPGGKYIYEYSVDGFVDRFNILTKRSEGVIEVGGEGYGSILASPDGRYIYVANGTGNCILKISVLTNSIVSQRNFGSFTGDMTLTLNGDYLYAKVGTSITKISTSNITSAGTVVADLNFNSMAISLDSNYLYALNSTTIKKISTATNAIISTTVIGTTIACGIGVPDQGIAVSPDNTFLLASHNFSSTDNCLEANQVFRMNLSTGSISDTFTVGSGPNGLAISSDSSFAYVANYGDSSVSRINLLTNRVEATIGVGFKPTNIVIARGDQLAFSEGSNLYNGNEDIYEISEQLGNPKISNPGVISISNDGVYGNASIGQSQINASYAFVGDTVNHIVRKVRTSGDPGTLVVVDQFTISGIATSIAISPDGLYAYIASDQGPGLQGQVLKIDTTTDQVLSSIDVGNTPLSVHFSHDGRRVFVLANDGTLTVIDSSSGAYSATNVGSGVTDIAISPDDSFAYIGSCSNWIKKLSLSNLTVIKNISGFSCPYSLGISSDGNYALVANNGSTTVSKMSTVTDTVTATIEVGIAPFSVSISPSSAYAFVGSGASNEIYELNMISNTVIRTYYEGPQGGVSVSPDGNFVLVSNADTMKTLTPDPLFTLHYSFDGNNKFGPINVGGPVPSGNFTINPTPASGITLYSSTGVGIFAPNSPGSYTYTVTGVNAGGSYSASITMTKAAPLPIPDPVQRSAITSISAVDSGSAAPINVTISGTFFEKISSIQINGTPLGSGNWVQTSTSISFTMPPKPTGNYAIQIFNGSVPLLPVQNFTITIPAGETASRLTPTASPRVTYIRCTKLGHGTRIAYGINPTCPAGYLKK